MKIIFCDYCNGRNVLNDSGLEKMKNHRCQICGRGLNTITCEEILDTASFKLLFVDDEPGFLQLMEHVLGQEYSVTIASNGIDAMKQAREIQPDLILLDINMPDIDGYELCRSMKLDDTTCHIPIIFVTANSGEFDEQIGFEVGGMDYITKPISIQVLQARIGLFLRLKQLSS